MAGPDDVVVRVPVPLRFLLPPRDRAVGERRLAFDLDATIGHVIRAAGGPPAEGGTGRVDGPAVTLGDRPTPGSLVEVVEVARPQPVPTGGFLLDVGLGSLAR